jgi:hypothetical protein
LDIKTIPALSGTSSDLSESSSLIFHVSIHVGTATIGSTKAPTTSPDGRKKIGYINTRETLQDDWTAAADRLNALASLSARITTSLVY